MWRCGAVTFHNMVREVILNDNIPLAQLSVSLFFFFFLFASFPGNSKKISVSFHCVSFMMGSLLVLYVLIPFFLVDGDKDYINYIRQCPWLRIVETVLIKIQRKLKQYETRCTEIFIEYKLPTLDNNTTLKMMG